MAALAHVTFRVTVREEAPGATVAVCCDPQQQPGQESVQFTHLRRLDASELPPGQADVTWTTIHPIALTAGAAVQYRYALLQDGAFLQWERLPDNNSRVVVAKNGLVLEDTFGELDDEQSTGAGGAGAEGGATEAEAGDGADAPDEADPSFTETCKNVERERLKAMWCSTTEVDGSGAPICYIAPRAASASATSTSAAEAAAAAAAAVAAKAAADAAASRKLLIVTYHLPVLLRKDETGPHWSAQWIEDDILAKTPDSIADDVPTLWVGVITRECVDTTAWNNRGRAAAVSTPTVTPAPAAAEAEAGAGAGAEPPHSRVLPHISLGAPSQHYEDSVAQGASNADSLSSFHWSLEHPTAAAPADMLPATLPRSDALPATHEQPSSSSGSSAAPSTPSVSADSSIAFTPEDMLEIAKTLNKMHVVPIFLPTALHEGFATYCLSVLKPAMHNVLETGSQNLFPKASSLAYLAEGWRYYLRANEVVGSIVASHYSAGDVIWVHDYQLCMVPRFMRKWLTPPGVVGNAARPAQVFFMHSPFPTSEIFRTLSVRDELLEAMLECDVVGFHTFNHARHFLHACKRLLGINFRNRRGGSLALDVDGRDVLVAISHVGVEAAALDRWMASEAAAAVAKDITAKYAGKVIIAGIDSCQRLSGVALKLLAFERLLEDNPIYRQRVVLVQRCETKAGLSADMQRTSAELRQRVATIKTTYGADVIDYEEAPSFPPSYRVGLFHRADILLQTPIREGLNLLPLEYVYVRTQWQIQRSKAYAVAAEVALRGAEADSARSLPRELLHAPASATSAATAGETAASGAAAAASADGTGASGVHRASSDVGAQGGGDGSSGGGADASGGAGGAGDADGLLSDAAFKAMATGMPGYYATLAAPSTEHRTKPRSRLANVFPKLDMDRANAGAGGAGAGAGAGAGDGSSSSSGGLPASPAPGSVVSLPAPSTGAALTSPMPPGSQSAHAKAGGRAFPLLHLHTEVAAAAAAASGLDPHYASMSARTVPPTTATLARSPLPAPFLTARAGAPHTSPGGGPPTSPGTGTGTGTGSGTGSGGSGNPHGPHIPTLHIPVDDAPLTCPLPPPPRGGCVILSEFSTASHILNSNLVVNPWSIKAVAREIDKALMMEDHERSFRQWRDYQYAIRNPSATWSRSVISDVLEIRAERLAAMPPAAAASLVASLAASSTGGGAPGAPLLPPPSPFLGSLNSPTVGGGRDRDSRGTAGGEGGTSLQAAAHVERSPVPALDIADCATAFKAAKKKVLFLDYGGTLISRVAWRAARHEFQLDGYAPSMPKHVLDALAALSQNPNTTIYVVSGLRSAAIEALHLSKVPCIGLAAENGMFISKPLTPVQAAALHTATDHTTGSAAALGFELSEVLASPASTAPTASSSSSAADGAEGAASPVEGGADATATPTGWVDRPQLDSAGLRLARVPPVPSSAASQGRQGSALSSVDTPIAISARGGSTSRAPLFHANSIRANHSTSSQTPSVSRKWEIINQAEAANMAEWESVKKRAVAIMTEYQWRVNGSVVREYESIVAWDFRNADAEWAQAQATFVASDLENLASQHVKVTIRKSRVEVALRTMNKGKLVIETLKRVEAEAGGVQPDFVLCVGDDTTDEEMFTALRAWRTAAAAAASAASSTAQPTAPPAIFTATVGKKSATAAQNYCVDVSEVQHLVLSLAETMPPGTGSRDTPPVTPSAPPAAPGTATVAAVSTAR